MYSVNLIHSVSAYFGATAVGKENLMVYKTIFFSWPHVSNPTTAKL